MQNKELLVDLYSIPGMTEYRLKGLLVTFQNPEAIFKAEKEKLTAVPGIVPELAQAIISYQRSAETAARLKTLRTLGVKIIDFLDPEFPENLRNLPHMPPVLFIRGEIKSGDRQAVAVIGTRRPSHYGQRVAERLAAELVRAGLTVVSGLARGIDTCAHRAALTAGGRTIAVLGSGIDVLYPPENRQLAEKIAGSGALVSEFPPGTGPLAMNFPKRNRLISALSRAVIAVEAGEKSGVLSTCSWAREQKRPVFAVPGRIDDERSTGTNRLIQQGARLITGIREVLESLGMSAPAETRQPVELQSEEKQVLKVVGNEPVHIDELCTATGMPIPELMTLLFQLEVKGLIRQLPGKFFVRT
ncbi:MAG: DNA-processing protein DprA [candidate division WOR-3 bacterium]